MGFDNECILNIHSLPGEYFCPVCRTLVYPNEALQSQCTHLYCKPCLAYIVATTHACPYDGYLVTEADSKPLEDSNKTVAEAIGKISVYCLYHRSGCQWQGTFSECITHSSGCTFGDSPVVCNRCGTQIIHRHVQEHAQSCPGLQPQAQQLESGHTQAGTSTAQGVAQGQSAATSSMPAATSLAASAAAAAPSALLSGSATTAVPVVASTTTAATPASSTTTITAVASQGQGQINATVYSQPGNVPTHEQYYQQQQLQYHAYYQQYPGYNPYQQYAQQQAYPQYVQSQIQVMPQNSVQGQPMPQPQPQPQASEYIQPHLHVQSQPSTQFQAQPQAQAQPQSQPQPQPQPQSQSQLNSQGQNQLLLHPQLQTQTAQLRPSQQSLLQTSHQPHPIAQGIQVQPQRPQVLAQQAHPQAHPLAHVASLAPGQQPVQSVNQTHYPQPQLHPQAAAHQMSLQSQPNAQVHPQHQQPHLLPQPHAFPSALPQHQIQQSHMHLSSQVIPQGQVQHPPTSVTGYQSYPQPPAIQQIPPGAPQQHPMFMHSQPQGTPFQHPQQPSQMQSQFPHQHHPPHGHMPTQGQHQSLNPAQASLAGYPHQQRPPHLVQQLHQRPGMHSQAPQQSLPSQVHSQLKPGQAHSQALLPQVMGNMQHVPMQPQSQQNESQNQGFLNNQTHMADGRPPMLSHATSQQPLSHSTSQFPATGGHGSLTSLSAASQPGVVDKAGLVSESEADVISKGSERREANNSDQLRIESSASGDLKVKNLKYENDDQNAGEILVNNTGLSAGTVETPSKQKDPGLSDVRAATLPATKEGTGHEEIRGIQVEPVKSTDAQPEEESNKGMNFGTPQPVHQDNPSKERGLSQPGYDKDGLNSEAPYNMPPAGLLPGQERHPQQIPYGHPSNFHATQRFSTPQHGMAQERRLQELPPYQMQTHVHAMSHSQMRASGPNLSEQFPLQGQPSIVPEPFRSLRGQHSHNSHPFDAPHGGIPGASLPISGGPPGHLGPPPRHLSEYGTAPDHVQSHMSMQHPARPIDGPSGPLDRPNLKPRGPPFGPDGQIGASRSSDGRSFLFDGKSDDLHGAESKVNGAIKGLVAGFRDPASARGLADGKFKPFPEEIFGHLSDDGLKAPQDGNMRHFQNLGRHASSRRDFEEDMKQFPRPAIMDGGSMPKFGTMTEPLGPEGVVRPFNGVLPGSDRISNFLRPGDPFAPGSTSEYHLMDSMKRHRPGPLLEDGHLMDMLPPLRNPGNLHGRNAFGLQNSPRGFLEDPLGQSRGLGSGGYPFPDYSQEPGQFGLKRKPGNSCWCLICKVDCETIEGLDLHSQTREHQKTTMDVVLSIKKENAKKPRTSAVTTVREEGSNSRKPGFGNQGVRK